MKNDLSCFREYRRTKEEWYNYFLESLHQNFNTYAAVHPYNKKYYCDMWLDELNEQFNKINTKGTYIIYYRIATWFQTSLTKEEGYCMEKHKMTIEVV